MIVDKRLDFGDVFPQWRLRVTQIGVLTTLTRRFAVLTILPPSYTGGEKRPGVIVDAPIVHPRRIVLLIPDREVTK